MPDGHLVVANLNPGFTEANSSRRVPIGHLADVEIREGGDFRRRLVYDGQMTNEGKVHQTDVVRIQLAACRCRLFAKVKVKSWPTRQSTWY